MHQQTTQDNYHQLYAIDLPSILTTIYILIVVIFNLIIMAFGYNEFWWPMATNSLSRVLSTVVAFDHNKIYILNTSTKKRWSQQIVEVSSCKQPLCDLPNDVASGHNEVWRPQEVNSLSVNNQML